MKKHEELVKDVMAYIIADGITVFGPRIAVVRDPEEEMTAGGLYIPEEGKRKEPKGTVVAVGLGVDADDELIYGVNVGDRVMFTKYNPIGFDLRLPDGREVRVELMHVSDLYIGMRKNNG